MHHENGLGLSEPFHTDTRSYALTHTQEENNPQPLLSPSLPWPLPSLLLQLGLETG